MRMVKSISEDDIKMALQPGWGEKGELSIGLDNWTVLDAFLEDDNGNSYLKRSVECHKQRFREAKMRDTVTKGGMVDITDFYSLTHKFFLFFIKQKQKQKTKLGRTGKS